MSWSVRLLDGAAAGVLVAAVAVLWRRGLVAIVRTLAVQGALVAVVAFVLGARERNAERLVIALAILVVKSVVVPLVLLRVLRAGTESRETEPLVNVPASILSAAALTIVAYVTARPLVGRSPTGDMRALPIGIAVLLIGLFAMVSRRTALSQAAGFLLVDNGIALTALLAASRIPLVVELGVLLDVMLAVLVVEVLVARMQTKFGATDLDLLRELHD